MSLSFSGAVKAAAIVGALFLFFFFPNKAFSQSSSCAANEAGQTLSFTTSPWGAGNTSYSATPGSGASQVTASASVAGGNLVLLSPATGLSGGYASTMMYTVDRTNATQTNTATFNFSKPVNRLQLTITDIDYFNDGNGAYNDQATIVGTSTDGSTLLPTATAASSLVEILGGNTARASSSAVSNNNCALTSSQCNATFSFNAPVTSITITYANTTANNWANGNPPSQLVGIYFNGFCVQNPDLTITKSAPATSKILTPFAFQLAANNPGSTASSGILTVTDTINASLLNIQSITSASGWTCTPNSGFPITSGSVTVSCTSSSPLAADASAVSIATISVSATAAALPGPATNSASISGGNEVNTNNNTATSSTALSRLQADLSINKSSSGTFAVGSTVNYTVTVTNSGPDTISGAVVQDSPVSNLNCPATNPVTCNGAACPSSPASLQFSHLSSGLSLGSLSAASGSNSVTLSFNCTVI